MKLDDFMGQKISLTYDHKFSVKWALADVEGETTKYPSMEEAKAAIKKAVAASGATEISVPVTTTHAAPATVKGINRTSSDLRGDGLGARGRYDSGPYINAVYPRDKTVPWIAEMIAWAVVLQAWSEHFWRLLQPLRINRSVHYGRMAIEDVAENLEEFQKGYRRKLALAQEGREAVASIAKEERE